MVTAQEALRELEALGTEQNRKIYRRHGIGDKMYGVSLGNLDALKKRIKVNHILAQELWATGNHDARALATRIADPKQMDDALLEAWVHDLDNYVLTDSFTGLVSRTPLVHAKMEQWTASLEEWTGRAGWQLLAHLAMKDAALPDAYFAPYLATIEQEIHSRPNRTRDAMNNALIAMGIRNDALESQALVAAACIGKVDVDHGETSCETPDAAAYIRKTRARQQARAQKGNRP